MATTSLTTRLKDVLVTLLQALLCTINTYTPLWFVITAGSVNVAVVWLTTGVEPLYH